MKEIARLLKLFNDRHPEYNGMVQISMFDDCSGHLFWYDFYIGEDADLELGFSGFDEFKDICENK